MATVLQSTGLLELDPEQLNFMWVTDFPLFTPNQHPSQGEDSVWCIIIIIEHVMSLYRSSDFLHCISRCKYYYLLVSGFMRATSTDTNNGQHGSGLVLSKTSDHGEFLCIVIDKGLSNVPMSGVKKVDVGSTHGNRRVV